MIGGPRFCLVVQGDGLVEPYASCNHKVSEEVDVGDAHRVGDEADMGGGG